MADPLADALNRVNADPQGADTSVPTVAPQPGLFRRMMNSAGDYIAGSNPRDLMEAFGRSNPMTAPGFFAKDLVEGTLVDNVRRQAGQLARVPTDIVGSVTGAIPGASAIKQLAFGGDALPGAEGLGEATDAVDAFGKRIGEAIAGQPLGNDVLRGSPAEMSANWMRQLASAVIPVPSKVSNVITAPLAKLTSGIEAVDKATLIAGKTIEALTPLAVDATPKGIALNAGLQGAMAPIAEAGGEGLKAALMQQAQADTEAKQAGPAVTEAATQLSAKPVQAGFLPSTGDPVADGLLVAGAGAAMLYAGHRRDLVNKVTNGITKLATGYDPAKLDDASIQSLRTKFIQNVGEGGESLPASLKKTLETGTNYPKNVINDMIDRNREENAARKGVSVSVREQKFFNEGEYMDTGIKTMPMNDLVLKHQSLPDPTIADKGLWAEQEVNNRQRMVEKGFGGTLGPVGSPQARVALERMANIPGSTPMQTNRYAINLYNTSTKDLLDIVRNARADPAVREVMDGFNDMMKKSGDYMASQQRFTPKEIAQFQAENPHYVPPSIKQGERFLDPRDPVKNYDKASGTDIPRGIETFEQLGSPMERLPSYMDEVFRSTEGFKTKRDYMLTMKRAADANVPYAKQIIGRDVKPTKEAEGNFVSWRDQYGAQRMTEIKDAVVRDALKNATSPTALQLSNGFMSAVTKWYESGAVGALSLANATLFAPKSALYAITAGTALSRPKGIAMGWLDRLSQDTIGVPIPGDIFTMIPDAALRSVDNIRAVLIERAARVLHNSVMTDGRLTKIWDPVTLQKQADTLRGWYAKTAAYELQERGLMGPASFSAVDRSKSFRDPTAALQGKGFIGESSSFVNDILHAISSSPAMSIMAMNKGQPEWKVNSAIRNMTGDPGRSGAFRGGVGNQLVSATPWGNVYIQSFGKLAGSFGDPRTAAGMQKNAMITAGIFNAAVLPAMMATMYNSSLGPDYTEHQFINQSPDKAASSIYIGKEGAHPTEGWNIDIDPLMRPFKIMGEALAGLHLGAFSGELHKDDNADMKAALTESMHNRYLTFGQNSVPMSVVNQTLAPPVSPMLGTTVGVATGGQSQLRNYGDVRNVPENKKGGFVEGTMQDPEKQSIGVGGFQHVLPVWVDELVKGMGASGAGAILNMFHGIAKDTNPNAAASGNVTKSLGGALENQGAEWLQRLGDSTSELGSGALLHTFRAMSPSQEATAGAVKVKVDALKNISTALAASERKGTSIDMVGNKKIGQEQMLGTHPVGPQDLETEIFAQQASSAYKQLQPTLQRIGAAYAERQNLQNSNQFTPVQKRALMEQEGYKVIDLNRRMLQDVLRFEAILSAKMGRPVTFDGFSKGKSLAESMP